MNEEELRRFIKCCFILCIFVCVFQCAQSFADIPDPTGISIGGDDHSDKMKDVQSMITTMQSIGFKWVAKVIGGFLVIAGVYKISSRDFMNGILATGGGGTLFFVDKIAGALSKMSG